MAEPSGLFSFHARVAVIGAGALGCAVLPRIARMRIAKLSIVDGDRVEKKNLERQSLFEEMDIGQFKASTVAGWMRQVLASGEVVAHDVFMDASNAQELLRDHDVVVEGVDDLHAKELIDRVCGELHIPLISGGVHLKQGQVMLLHATNAGLDLSRSDVFGGRSGVEQDGCDMRHVPMHVIEEVAQRMAWRVRELLSGVALKNGRIEQFDGDMRAWLEIEPPNK